MADAIAKRQEELAELITEELGCTLFLSQVYQVVSPVMSLNYNAEIGRSLDTSEVRLSDLGPLAASSEGGSIIPMAGLEPGRPGAGRRRRRLPGLQLRVPGRAAEGRDRHSSPAAPRWSR